MTSVLVLGGGPDAEREVSLVSARSVGAALKASGKFEVIERTIDRPDPSEVRSWPGDVVFPVLHGAFGEGGPLQDMLEAAGRRYVGCRPGAARAAMDKIASKLAGSSRGIPTAEARVFNWKDQACPLSLPVVAKPVHDGSSVGLHIIKTPGEWDRARGAIIADIKDKPGRVYMLERFIAGRELTCGVLDGRALPLIQITPADGPYDYQAKYHREDTRYTVEPELPPGVTERVQAWAVELFKALGCRHLSRVDFIMEPSGSAWLLEINTMPGFTDHSLLPMAAAKTGLPMPALCAKLVELALCDGSGR